MLTTTTTQNPAFVPTRNDSLEIDTKLIISNPSSSSEVPSSQPKVQWDTSISDTSISNSADNCSPSPSMNINSPSNTRQRKRPPSTPPPSPFLSFKVKNQDCAVYVGNIPIDERRPCKGCFRGESDDSNGNDQKKVIMQTQNNNDDKCTCALELKAFLRDRINAAFKVPVEEIGIRTCRLFSVVTNVYSNPTTPTTPRKTLEEGGDANIAVEGSSEEGEAAAKFSPLSFRHRSGRRVHRAACVEFEDPKIAEHTLALKFTSFHFEGQPHNRSSLRMRRWTMEPPPPPPPKSPSPKLCSPKRRPPPSPPPQPPPRSKSDSPKISYLREELLPPPAPRPKSVSPKIGCRIGKSQQRRKQISNAVTINERLNFMTASSPTMNGDHRKTICDEKWISPSLSSCVHVRNIPTDATVEDIRLFILERMNKAFHGVTPPQIVRLGTRHRGIATIGAQDTAYPNTMDAFVEFQDSSVAFRATQLKHRRWPVKEGESEDTSPFLEFEYWDNTKHNTSDFILAYENDINSSMIKNDGNRVEEDKEYYVSVNDTGEDGVETTRKPPARTSSSNSRKAIAEARECGFLVCTNPNKTPKCDHLFTFETQPGEENCCVEVKKARMCHGYAFRGKVCRHHKKNRGSKRDLLCGATCPYAHIDSFDQLKDPHDILALLYYVHNNDEVEFRPGNGCTPQEYLLQLQGCQPKTAEGTSSTESTQPNQRMETPSQATEYLVQELRSNLSAVQQELESTRQQLHKSECERQSFFELKRIDTVGSTTEDASTQNQLNEGKFSEIRFLQNEVARLKIDLDQTNAKWKASALAAENSKRDYKLLNEKHQQQVDHGKSQITTEFLQLEVIKLREQLQHSLAENQQLKQQQLEASPTSLEEAFPEFVEFDNFLEKSIPTLMQMTDRNRDEQPQHSCLKPRMADIPSSDRQSSRPYKNRSLGSATTNTTNTMNTMNTSATEEDSLRSEISYLVSFYGNQVSIMNGASTIVTRFLKLPMGLYKGRDIDVALVITLPKGYPWNGFVKVDTDPRFTNYYGGDCHYRKLVAESVSGLLNVCRWEAEACQGTPHVLMNIMKTAERWVKNDWTIIQKKHCMIDLSQREVSPSSSFNAPL